MAHPSTNVILLTGCSTGIGLAAAKRLAGRGHIVYATARRPESVEQLQQWAAGAGDNARAARLDVTDAQTGREAVARILDECGRLDVLVNNAGYGQPGAIEDLTTEQLHHQFDVNLYGLIALTQAALPAMRAAGHGRIINVSSVVAHVALPFMGAYSATKHALDAASCALRREVWPWGIDVVIVEPGPIKTEFRANALKSAETDDSDTSPYAAAYATLTESTASAQAHGSADPDDVALAIQRAVEARRPKTRYTVTAIARWTPYLVFFLGDRLTDRLLLRPYRKVKSKTAPS
jgi:NAD(P)-dependent dehydrogenase (short-subunit alcohol dehydrogenase family)